jgi:hypothetical protein
VLSRQCRAIRGRQRQHHQVRSRPSAAADAWPRRTARNLDRDARHRGQGQEQRLILLVELTAAPFLGQVQIAADLVPAGIGTPRKERIAGCRREARRQGMLDERASTD